MATPKVSFRFDETTKHQLRTLAEWENNDQASAVRSAIAHRYMQVRERRLAAGLPVDDLTNQEGQEVG